MKSEPDDLVSHAADAAIEAAKASLSASGVELSMMLVTLVIEDPPEGEVNASTAGHGFEGDAELMAFLLQTVEKVSASLGVDVRVIQVGGDG